jgi:hypothetical protein
MEFINKALNFFLTLFQNVIDIFLSIIEWLYDLVLWVPQNIFYQIMDALGHTVASAGDLVCVSACINAVNGISTAFNNFPPIARLAFPYLHLSTGIELIVCAYLVRFVIRRIPFIG